MLRWSLAIVGLERLEGRGCRRGWWWNEYHDEDEETWSEMTVATLERRPISARTTTTSPALFFDPLHHLSHCPWQRRSRWHTDPSLWPKTRTRTRTRTRGQARQAATAATAALLLFNVSGTRHGLSYCPSPRLRKRDERRRMQGLPAIEIPMTIQHLSTYGSGP
jgi:hypothetical protein